MARGGVRVIAGVARGRRLAVPAGARPTTDRVREAVFSSLGDVAGTRILDLFAGSGAAAIEALSRGAEQAVLVDHDRDAAATCRANLETTGLSERARVQCGTVAAVLRQAVPAAAPFDLVVADPPYDAPSEEIAGLLDALRAPGWLAPEARVVVERRARDEPVDLPAGWKVVSERKYGDTLVLVLCEQD